MATTDTLPLGMSLPSGWERREDPHGAAVLGVLPGRAGVRAWAELRMLPGEIDAGRFRAVLPGRGVLERHVEEIELPIGPAFEIAEVRRAGGARTWLLWRYRMIATTPEGTVGLRVSSSRAMPVAELVALGRAIASGVTVGVAGSGGSA